MSVVLSKNLYTRAEAEEILKGRKWFQDTDKEIQQMIFSLPERSNGFVNDLADRPVVSGDFELIRISAFTYSKPFVFTTYDVKSTFTGKIYQKVVTSRDKGTFHSLRGILLLETAGRISHFVVRNYDSFSAAKVIPESLGSIYPPENFRTGDKISKVYLEGEIKKMMRLPEVNIDRCFDLGQIYPDQAMSDNIVSLFAAVMKVKNIEILEAFIKNKKYDDRDYSYWFSIKPVSELLDFLSQTQDSYLLATFGRLQALNVIKL